MINGELIVDNFAGGGGASTGGSFGESQPAQSTPNFGRDESPFGNSNPMDISDDDLPF